jgi:uncharacterized glyoxalase superfamily protein PhnB
MISFVIPSAVGSEGISIPGSAVGAAEDSRCQVSVRKVVFGFTRTNVNEEHGDTLHAELLYQDRIVAMVAPSGMHAEAGISPASADRESFTEFLIYVDDADACYARALAAGAVGIKEPMDVIWGERLGNIRDSDGYRWLLAQNLNG